MNQAIKTLSTLAFALAFVAAPALAQNQAAVTQTGSAQTAGISQTGTNNATITQIGTQNDVLDAAQAGIGNVLSIEQTGSENLVDGFTQFDQGNVATITQVGYNNDVGQNPDQGRAGDASKFGQITIDQYGNNNDVWDVDQRGGSQAAFNEISIRQGDVQSTVRGNLVDVDMQRGLNNELTITQSSDGNEVGSGHASVRGVYQDGNGNSLTVAQGGLGGHKLGTTLSGFGGFVTPNANAIYQDGGSTATVTQDGANQTVEYLVQQGGSYAEILQNDADNVARVAQLGGPNVATVEQFAAGGNATVHQDGSGNTATVTQQ